MNVVIYARCNTPNQTENAIKGQLDKCYEYAQKNNLNVIGLYVDNGFSGINENRPQFQQMLQDSSKKQFQGVLVYQIDRFSRNAIETVMQEKTLNDNGVQIISVCEDLANDPSRILLKSIIQRVSKYYSAELEKKTKTEMENV